MKKILIFKSDKIGDLINISPVIKNLRLNYPNSKIYLFCSKYNSSVALYYSDINKLFIYENNFIFFLIKYFKVIIFEKFDLILQLDGKKKSYFYSILFRTKSRAGIRFIKSKKILNFNFRLYRPNFLYNFFYKIIVDCFEDYQISNNKSYHYLSIYLNILKKLGLKIIDTNHFLPFTPNKNSFSNKYVQIHIDERWDKFDNTFLENFINKLNEIKQNRNFVITSNYSGNNFFNKLKNIFYKNNQITFVSCSSVKEILNIIYYAETVISSHSGFLVHSAAAFKKHVIDIVNKKIDNELNRWVPLNSKYKRIYFENINSLNISYD